jgi:hypothetical protein
MVLLAQLHDQVASRRLLGLGLRAVPRLVETDLRDLQKLLNRDPKTARAELTRHISKITLTPREAIYVGV